MVEVVEIASGQRRSQRLRVGVGGASPAGAWRAEQRSGSASLGIACCSLYDHLSLRITPNLDLTRLGISLAWHHEHGGRCEGSGQASHGHRDGPANASAGLPGSRRERCRAQAVAAPSGTPHRCCRSSLALPGALLEAELARWPVQRLSRSASLRVGPPGRSLPRRRSTRSAASEKADHPQSRSLSNFSSRGVDAADLALQRRDLH